MEKLTGIYNTGKITDFLRKEWKFILICIAVIAGFWLAYGEYKEYKQVPITTISSNPTKTELDATALKLGVKPRDITRGLELADTKPQAVWTSPTQEQSDKKAQAVAKADKADEVVKQTTTKDDGQIVNKYVGMHLEKNNKVKAGFTYVDNEMYLNVGYQHKKDELILHMQPEAQPIKGVTYMRTIAEW